MSDKRGWIGLKAENHGGPGRAGPQAKMYRWRAKVPLQHWVNPSKLFHSTISLSPRPKKGLEGGL